MRDWALNMQYKHGEIVFYQADDGGSSFEVSLYKESVWLSLNQMVELFGRDKSVVSRHLNNIFKSGELKRDAVVAKNATTAADGKTYQVDYFNLDAIISVGYRVNSIRGTQFRIWATSVLKDHLTKGYTVNERRLAEKGLVEIEQAVSLLSRTLQTHELVTDEGKAVLDVVTRYAKSWTLLLQYDEDQLKLPKESNPAKQALDYEQAKRAIATLKVELVKRGEASDLFGQEREGHLQGILGSINQTFDGEDLYPSVEEKAAHLLYFVIKDHPFSDGNKRIGAFLFLLFLGENNLLEQSGINENGLVALALLIAESDPRQKDLMIRLILNLLKN
ncbi:MAG: prophage maintenance system killer protein [Desulforhopalus sp.]|jgi:prophage maintenance system killer protein